jgi:hypothetical protein
MAYGASVLANVCIHAGTSLARAGPLPKPSWHVDSPERWHRCVTVLSQGWL